MRIRFLQKDSRVIVFLKTPVVDNNHLVAFKKMLEFVRHTDDRVILKVLFDNTSYEIVRFCVETIEIG
jgi:hypothetical protein